MSLDRPMNVMTILSVALFLLVLFSVRRSHIRVEYSVSWLAASVVLIILSRSRAALEWLAGYLGLNNPPLALVMLAAGVFLLVFYRFSLIISDLRDANIAMAQRLAILEYRLRSHYEGQ